MTSYKRYFVIITIVLCSVVFSSCEKDNDLHTVIYVVKGLTSDFQVAFLDENEQTVKYDSITITDKAKGWTYTWQGKPGDLTYLYLRYKDNIDMMSGFYAAILVDGVAIEQAFNYDMADTNRTYPYQIIRQGYIPF